MHNVEKIYFNEIKDKRGSLVALENSETVPFDIKRIYYIYNVPQDEERGFHSHRILQQVLICLGGKVKIRVKDFESEEIFVLDNPNEGLYIGPMIWREMLDFTEKATLLVLASEKYDNLDYIRDFNDYLKEAKEYFSEINKIDNYMIGKNIDLKFVEQDDAEFLFKIRTNVKLNKYLSKIDNSIQKQKEWIKSYKIREFNRKEFYFKVIDKAKNDVGFARLYNIDYNKRELTFGSFIIGENKPHYAALETLIMLMNISFKYLKMDKVKLDVRKENTHAKNFYNRFGFKKVCENDLDEFYELEKQEYTNLYEEKYRKYIG